jgi:hypothetical protein
MGSSDLESLVIHRPDETVDLLIFDPMPGGSGLLDQMLQRWQEIIRATKELLHECPQGCEQACYSCLLSFRNQFHHGRLNRHKALELIASLQWTPNVYRQIEELDEETSVAASRSSPTNNPEARLLRLLRDHHFPEGQCQVEIKTTAGLATRPDWLHESTKVAIYLDGMSRHLFLVRFPVLSAPKHGEQNVFHWDERRAVPSSAVASGGKPHDLNRTRSKRDGRVRAAIAGAGRNSGSRPLGSGRGALQSCGFMELNISAAHALATETLPMHHRAPFDRILVA